LNRRLALILLILALAAVPRAIPVHLAAGAIAGGSLPYLPGSILPDTVYGFTAPYRNIVSGPGAGESTVIAAGPHGLSARTFTVAPTPDPAQPFVAVASYDDGVILHDAQAPFRARAALGIDGAPGDVAIDPAGRLASAATNGTTAAIATLDPWAVHLYQDVPFCDELAFDSRTGALFITNRDVGGAGALTRITSDGSVSRRVLGLTAEGLAIDAARGRVYVANVNDGTVSVVDADSMVELHRFHVVDRVFSLALSRNGSRLYAVSNQSLQSPFGAAGSVVAVDVADGRVVARSARLAFPIGIAADPEHNRLYVTDEDTNAVDVLDARTLRSVHAPLRTCDTPWKPTLDRGLLWIPCTRSDQIDVIDTATLRRITGAPFTTGGYPLAVAIWHGRLYPSKLKALPSKVDDRSYAAVPVL
jgi:DNA-binding beta-propeller fold protein YncE